MKIASLAFADSDVQDLVGKPKLRVCKDGSCKLLHPFLRFSTKLRLIDSILNISNEFSSVDKNNIFEREAEVFQEEFDDDSSDCFP